MACGFFMGENHVAKKPGPDSPGHQKPRKGPLVQVDLDELLEENM